jgi:hypothetical protein
MMDLRETGLEDVDWIHLAQGRDHGNETAASIESEELLD